ncbi:MAG: hypothetical protein HKN76_00805, partial [Saprospiraceae bacterium]|nr:hypothetical protein [Saprospiraceae bacterium]
MYKIRSGLTLLVVLLTLASSAQIDSSQINESPYTVVYNHLYYLQQDSYDPGRAALSFPETNLKKERVAIMLKDFLDGKGYYIDLNRIPKNPEYIDNTSE